ncbi:MAG: cell division protein ZapA [Chitinivibrionales bacterium]|nr:cell division protein ZapA [Chitinivibrionales bacterium]
MGLSSESIHVQIHGDEYSIKSDTDEETIKKVAEYVNAKIIEIQEKTASRDRSKVAVLAAMNIAGELFELRQQYDQHQKQIEQIAQKTRKIEQSIQAQLT